MCDSTDEWLSKSGFLHRILCSHINLNKVDQCSPASKDVRDRNSECLLEWKSKLRDKSKHTGENWYLAIPKD